jgi:hypothetical protein
MANLSFKGWRPRTALVIDQNNPRGVGVCDGCSFWVNHVDLEKHMVYRGGTSPVWDGLLFCSKCQDVPNPAPQFSRLALLPDPVPLLNPRPETTVVAQSGFGYMTTETGMYANTIGDDDTWGGDFGITIPTETYP